MITSGPVTIAPRVRVDGDDDDDDAFLGEHAPVAQHALADVADDAVDVQVARGHLLAARHAEVGEQELVAVLAHEHALVAHAHRRARVGHGSSGGGTRRAPA